MPYAMTSQQDGYISINWHGGSAVGHSIYMSLCEDYGHHRITHLRQPVLLCGSHSQC